MRALRGWRDIGLAAGWAAAALVFLAGFGTAGYTGWATGFAAWSALAVGLLVVTNRRFRATGREALRASTAGAAIWVGVLVVAIGTQAWFASIEPGTEPPPLVGWALVAFAWGILTSELAVVCCVTYAAATGPCSPAHREAAT